MVNTELSGKGEKAFDRLKAIKDEADNIKGIISTIANCLAEVVEEARVKLEPNSEQERTKLLPSSESPPAMYCMASTATAIISSNGDWISFRKVEE